MIIRIITIICLSTGLFAQVAKAFKIPSNFKHQKTVLAADTSQPGLLSNVISEIKLQGDSSWVWLGTGRGLSRVKDSLTVETFFTNPDLTSGSNTNGFFPEGGVSAIAVKGDTVFAAFARTINDFPTGQGIVYTSNSMTDFPIWTFYDQPIDASDAVKFPFGSIGFIEGLPVTVPQYNVTYDASIGGGYVWTTSWAGGLRRYKIADGSWERVPIPQDDQLMLVTCADTSYETIDNKNILKNFYLNPRDPIDGGNHNHKAFSVLAYSDTVWVGTANGINRGISGDEGCIDWEHYAYPFENITGNFVVSIARQNWNGKRIIWAATMNADDPTEQRGVSYTFNDGGTWNTALVGERVYNVFSRDSLVFAASEKGLWKSEDGQSWALFKPAKNITPLQGDETLSSEVFAVVLDSRKYYNNDPVLWIGTGDGVARSSDLHGSNWQIYRADYNPDKLYAFPNPFSPKSHNVLDGDGYVRFHLGAVASNVVEMNVYNFAMENVYSTLLDRQNPNTGAIKWNGKDSNGRLVDNGVYFIKLKYSQNINAGPSNHWVKLIVVK
ncbi:MAG: hypothetical protein ACE5D0_07680 [Fidelibacterota bacterium]